jgi:putative FmdB family regulatory protein
MPTYDYVCDACQHRYELVQSMKDSPIKKCPKCKKQKARRLLGTGGGIIFKGTGFYQTDYKSPAKKEPPQAGPASGAKPDTCAKPECGPSPSPKDKKGK